MRRLILVLNVITCNVPVVHAGASSSSRPYILRARQRHALVPEGIARNALQDRLQCVRKVQHHRRAILPLRVMWRHAIVWDTITYAGAISLCKRANSASRTHIHCVG